MEKLTYRLINLVDTRVEMMFSATKDVRQLVCCKNDFSYEDIVPTQEQIAGKGFKDDDPNVVNEFYNLPPYYIVVDINEEEEFIDKIEEIFKEVEWLNKNPNDLIFKGKYCGMDKLES